MYKDKYMEFSDKIKWIGGFNNNKDNLYTFCSLNIYIHKGKKTRGIDEWKYIVVIKLRNEHVVDFTYTYKSRKMGNTGVAKMLIDNKYKIVMRIFK